MTARAEPPPTAPSPWAHHDHTTNGVRLHYVEAGAGEPIVLLHGFPEFWYSWRHQLPALAAAGFRRALRRPGGLTGPLNYYRAALLYPRDLNDPPQTVAVPTLTLWGERDPYLGVGLAERARRWVPDLRVERIPDASHWVQNDVPDRVNAALVRFFSE